MLASSYIFYLVSSSWLVIYLMITTSATFFAGKLIGGVAERYNLEKKSIPSEDRAARKKADTKRKKMILTLVLLFNLSILAVFKYSNFAIDVYNSFAGIFKIEHVAHVSFLMPLGISFYTFQSIGYLVDVYRGKYKPDGNIFKFALFVSFFPQIVQGPIGRYDELAGQLYEPHTPSYERTKSGMLLIAYGMIKKMILADRIAVIASNVFTQGNDANAGSVVFFAAMCSGFQLYCDFSGGIDISRGVARIFGITLRQNFQRPYFANSIADFWRRWHISLSEWMRDYVFYSMMLSKFFQNMMKNIRKKWGSEWARIIPTSIASFILFTIIGIWHDADITRIMYGFYMATLISLSILLEPVFKKLHALLKINAESFLYRIFTIVRTIILINFSRYFVQAKTLADAFRYFKLTFASFAPEHLFNGYIYKMGLSEIELIIVLLGIVTMFIIGIYQETGRSVYKFVSERNIVIRWAVYYAMLMMLIYLQVPTNTGGFLYAQY